jgi:hypothetical protein
MEVPPLVAVGLQRLEQGRHPRDQLVDHVAIMSAGIIADLGSSDGRRGVKRPAAPGPVRLAFLPNCRGG